MLELRGNMFDPLTWQYINGQRADILFDAICITTNGFRKNNGYAVMGRGCAKEVKQRFSTYELDKILGQSIQTNGNNVSILINHHTTPIPYSIISFPVKPISIKCSPNKDNVVKHMQQQFKPGNTVPGWAAIADKELIIRSARQLMDLIAKMNYQAVVMPRPGCGAGELNWLEVKRIIESILDDSVYVITYGD